MNADDGLCMNHIRWTHWQYLIQDHRFIDAFVVLLSSMIAHARKLEDRIPGAQFLGLITGKENTYFERSFEALGVTKQEREQTPDAPAMSGFQAQMRDAAKSGSLGEVRTWREPTAPPRLSLSFSSLSLTPLGHATF